MIQAVTYKTDSQIFFGEEVYGITE